MHELPIPAHFDPSHVGQVWRARDQISNGVALKVPLEQLEESKENVRSALNRATRKRGHHVATASDDTFLYVWNETT